MFPTKSNSSQREVEEEEEEESGMSQMLLALSEEYERDPSSFDEEQHQSDEQLLLSTQNVPQSRSLPGQMSRQTSSTSASAVPTTVSAVPAATASATSAASQFADKQRYIEEDQEDEEELEKVLENFDGDLFKLVKKSATRKYDWLAEEDWFAPAREETKKPSSSSATSAAGGGGGGGTTSAASASPQKPQTQEQKQKQEQQQKQEQEEDEEEEGPVIYTESEGCDMFLQEVESLQSVFGDENVVVEKESTFATSYRMSCITQILTIGDMEEVTAKRFKKTRGVFVTFLKPRRYPAAPLEPSIDPSCIFTFQEQQELYKSMMHVIKASKGELQLFNCVSAASQRASEIIVDGVQQADDSKRVELAEEMSKVGYSVRKSEEELLNPAVYVGPMSKILNTIPRGVDVHLVENVLRKDLAMKFERKQREFFVKYIRPRLQKDKNLDLKNDPALRALADTTVGWHGTSIEGIHGIVHQGFKRPKSRKEKEGDVYVSCGSVYGRATYCAMNPDYSLWYADTGKDNEYSVKLIVCAVLRGRAKVLFDDESRMNLTKKEPNFEAIMSIDDYHHLFPNGDCVPGFDSHVCEYNEQMCMFDVAQVLPCYVLHLMFRKRRLGASQELSANKLDSIKDDLAELETEARQNKLKEGDASTSINSRAKTKTQAKIAQQLDRKKKELLTALARKNLPSGFGAAGINFVVEEIAPYDDDEEDSNEYVAGTYEGGKFADEFNVARAAKPEGEKSDSD